MKYSKHFRSSSNESEREKLQLEMEPPEFPIITIKAPVPWKCSVQIAKNRLDQVLMNNHPTLQAINLLWHHLYNDLIIIDTSKMYKDDVPLQADVVTDLVNNCCLVARDVRLFRHLRI